MKKKISSLFFEKLRAYYHKVMSLPDSPRKIAGGVALGLSFDFLPIPIISIPLSYLAARLVRLNPVAAVATVVIFKLAVPVFFTLNVLTGNIFLGDMPGPEITIPGTLPGSSFLSLFFDKLVEHGYPFLLGSVINATLVWLAVYFLLMFLLERRRRRGGA